MENYYTKEEQEKIDNELNFQIYFHLFLCIFGFYLIFRCYKENEFNYKENWKSRFSIRNIDLTCKYNDTLTF